MKANVIVTIMLLVFGLVSASLAEIVTVELPEFIGDLQPYPNGSTASFDFGTSFLQIDQVRIQMSGTFTPGLAYRNGDELVEVPPDIEVYADPGIGLCGAILHPVESPFSLDESFLRWFGATWDFLLDGKGEVTANLTWGIGWDMVIPPTANISQAYLLVEGTIPEPTTFLFFLMGIVCIRRTKNKFSDKALR